MYIYIYIQLYSNIALYIIYIDLALPCLAFFVPPLDRWDVRISDSTGSSVRGDRRMATEAVYMHIR